MKNLMVVAAFLTLVGCLDTQNDIRAEEERRVLQSQMSYLQKNTADHVARYQEYDEQIRQLTGRIETLESQMNQISTQQQAQDSDRQKTATELDEKLKLVVETTSTLQDRVSQLEHAASEAQTAQTATREAASVEKSPWDQALLEFNSKNWKKAIVALEKYRSANPKGKHYASATLKIGASFQELGMKQEARSFYEEVLAKFPKSDEARRAQTRLKQLK